VIARVRRRLAVHPTALGRARRRVLRDPDLTERERTVLARLDLRVHPGDTMHVGASEHYLRVGLSALRCVDAAGVNEPRRVLDLPCGHGRVLRTLAAAFPQAELTAADLDRGGVDFCAERFGATPLYAPADPCELALPDGSFDLIWCGSLITHLDEAPTLALLESLAAALAPGGRLLVTTHGDWVAERLASGEADYQLDAAGIDTLLAGYRRTGFGYADYPWSPGYGVTVTAPDWLRERSPLQVVDVAERGWDAHQDVHVLARPT
jgi:SAM-dependent methyltransferase